LIAATVLLLGGFVYLGLQMPLFAGMLMTSGMAFVHGYAHGTEIPADAPVPGFILGFLLATALLHGTGLVIAPRFNSVMRRMAGGLIAGCGSVLLALAF
jgi:urease accessory protein